MNGSKRQHHPLTAASALLLVLAITTGWSEVGPQAAVAPTPAAAHVQGAMVAQAADRAGTFDRSSWPVALAGRSAHLAILAGASAMVRVRELAPPKPVVKPEAKPPAPKERAEPRVAKPAPPVYAGRNRFWIPSLKMSYRVHLFECTRNREPDHYMYRWGCAGTNNVYILGHASSVMKPLHDAYESGRLKVGMKAIYADGNGKVRTYRVTEWRVVDPVDSHWAIASQPVPSMTLQTCVGPKGVLRLNVRLVAVD